MSVDTELRAAWRDVVERRLPEAARRRNDWPVRLDHCFARVLLDNACGRPGATWSARLRGGMLPPRSWPQLHPWEKAC